MHWGCSTFQINWKNAKGSQFPNPGKDPKIPLFSNLGKIYWRILLNKLSSNVFSNNLIPEEQFGIMASFSTIQQLLDWLSISGLELKWTTVAVLDNIAEEKLSNTFKYHVSCTDGKISVRINLFFTYFFKILKTNNYNNQWFKLQLLTAQARRQRKLQHP